MTLVQLVLPTKGPAAAKHAHAKRPTQPVLSQVFCSHEKGCVGNDALNERSPCWALCQARSRLKHGATPGMASARSVSVPGMALRQAWLGHGPFPRPRPQLLPMALQGAFAPVTSLPAGLLRPCPLSWCSCPAAGSCDSALPAPPLPPLATPLCSCASACVTQPFFAHVLLRIAHPMRFRSAQVSATHCLHTGNHGHLRKPRSVSQSWRWFRGRMPERPQDFDEEGQAHNYAPCNTNPELPHTW